MQTITTVGYGDTPVVTFWGRINAVFLMLTGIGTLSLFIASFTNIMIESSLAKRLGEIKVKKEDHIIICNWNEIGEELVKELKNQSRDELVILADKDSPPLNEIEFVRGTCLKESDLIRAGIKNAYGVIILADKDDKSSPAGIDAKSILAGIMIKKLNANSHIVLELLSKESENYAKLVGIYEFIIRGYVSAKLISRTLENPGTAEVIDLILTSKSGDEIFEEKLPQWMHGKKYKEISDFITNKGALPLAIRGPKGLRINPPKEEIIDDDSIIYISKRKINLNQ